MKRRIFGIPEEFDPYHKWLGISQDKRPPTLYQLLGVSPSEDDRDAITAAAERQQSFVRKFRGGPHDEAAASILYQIEDAHTTLLDHEARRKYDATLNLAHKRQRETARGKALQFGSGSNSVGEGSGLVSQFAGIMAIIIGGFVIMALVAFYISRGDKEPVQPVQAPAAAAGPAAEPRPGDGKPEQRDVAKNKLGPEPVQAKNAIAPAPAAAEICRFDVLKELPPGANHTAPWLSPDGLTLYFVSYLPNEKQGWIWSGRRKDKDSLFGDFQRLVPGTEPTVTADGLEIILNVDNVLESATRKSTDEAFGRPRKINELGGAGLLAGPSLSSDGLTLNADRWAPGTTGLGKAPVELVRFTRATRSSKWGPPESVRFANLPAGIEGIFRFLFVTADKLHALAMLRTRNVTDRRVLVFSRQSDAAPFEAPTMVSVEGDTRFGFFPRYVESTGELFCTRQIVEGQSPEIVVIRNFDFAKATVPFVAPAQPLSAAGPSPGARTPAPKGWISIMPTKDEVSGTDFAKYQDGILSTDVKIFGNFGSRKRGYEAENGVIRVVVKKLAGQAVYLFGRASDSSGGFYQTHFNGDGFGVGKMVSRNGKSTFIHLGFKKAPRKFNDYFEYTFRVEGDQLTVLADDKEVLRVRDTEITGKGEMGFSSQNGRGMFKKAEIKIRD